MGEHDPLGIGDHPLLYHPLSKTGYSPSKLEIKDGKRSGKSSRGTPRRAKLRGVKGEGGRGWIEGGGLAKFESGRDIGIVEDPLVAGEEDVESEEDTSSEDENTGEVVVEGLKDVDQGDGEDWKVVVRKARDGGYLITRKGFTGVRRTVGDFLFVHARLKEVYRGLFVPELPALALKGIITHGYAHEEKVLKGLQGFVKTIYEHPRLGRGSLVRAFVTGEGWEAERRKGLVRDDDVGLFGWLGFVGWKALRGANESVAGWLDERQGEVGKEHKMEDRQEALTQYVEGLSKGLERLRKGLGVMEEGRELMEGKMEEVGKLVEDFVKMEQEAESEASSVLQAFARACAVYASSGSGAARVGESKKVTEEFREAMKDLERRAVVARRVLNTRGDEKSWYEYAIKDYVAKRDQLEKEGGANGGSARLRQAVTDAAAVVASKREAYALIAGDVDAEMRQFREDLRHGLDNGLVNVAKDMIKWHTQMTRAWTEVEEAVSASTRNQGA